MINNPKEIARTMRQMADQLDPPEPPENVTPYRITDTPPIERALDALQQVDRLMLMGMTRRLAISTTARATGLGIDALELALSQRAQSRIWQRNFVIDWMTRQGRTATEIAAATGLHEGSVRRNRSQRRKMLPRTR